MSNTATFTLNDSARFPLQVLANRYRVSDKPGGSTIILLHAAGLHKETWEPTIASLVGLSAAEQRPTIREVWSIECPNHGESAGLNQQRLQSHPDEWDGYTYARAVHAFLSSGPGGENLLTHNLVLVGHSIGGNTALHLQTLQPRIRFASVVLLDATIRPHGASDHVAAALSQLVWLKPDTWPARKHAAKAFAAMPGYKHWDKRVLELYVKYALRTHHAASYPAPHTFRGVTLACTREYEAACYRTVAPGEAFDTLQELYVQGPPVHLVFSTDDEFKGHDLKQEQLKLKEGRGPASVQWLKGAKHLFVQQMPEATAQALWECIKADSGRSSHRL